MKILVAEDDFISRKILHHILKPHGGCDFASHGKEAVEAFSSALAEGAPYNLLCLDINMPQLSGLDVLKEVRAIEEQKGIGGLDGVKIIMTTGQGDSRSILGAFKAGCEAYIVKPFDREKLLAKIFELGLLKAK